MCRLASKEIRLYAICDSAARSPNSKVKPNPYRGSRICNNYSQQKIMLAPSQYKRY